VEPRDIRIEFLSAMAGALSRFGLNADATERGLRAAAAALDLRAEFHVTPTSIMASFGVPGRQRVVLLRTHEATIDLQSLSLVTGVLDGVIARDLTAEQAHAELNLITRSPLRFPWFMAVFASGVGAASFDLLLSGHWIEAAVAAEVGLAIGVLIVLGRRYARLARLTELLAGLLATVLALGAAHILPEVRPASVSLASVILLLPGLGITLGVAEIAARHLTAGTARLAGAMMTLLNLSIGSFLGYKIMSELGLVPDTGPPGDPATLWMLVAAAGLSSVALLIATNSRPADLWLVAVSVAVALVGARFGAWLLGATLGVALASLGLGLWSNAYARLSRRPAALALLPGLAVLVPGSLGQRGVTAALMGASAGIDLLGAALVIAAGLVVGLLVADATLAPAGGYDDG
jgi:uncharacterized membrane protein YjjP (DUF1212 family)